MSSIIQEIQPHWTVISRFMVIRNEQDYDRVVALLDHLLDEIGTNEAHLMYEFLDTIGTILHAYEEKNYPIPVGKWD